MQGRNRLYTHRMGSLDASYLQNANGQMFMSRSHEFATEYGNAIYCDYVPPQSAPCVADGDVPQSYNPFASGYCAQVPVGHPPTPYSPLSQSLPAYPACYSSDRPSSGNHHYNPFSQEYDFPPGNTQEQGVPVSNSFVPYNYIPARLCTPPSVRQYSHHLVHPHTAYPVHTVYPVQQEIVPPSPKDSVIPFDGNNAGKSQRLLWLSEEEAEIIRLIRLSQMKENLKTSGFSLTEEQLSPSLSPENATEFHVQTSEKAALNTPSKLSNISAMSVEEFSLPTTAEVTRITKQELSDHHKKEVDVSGLMKVENAKTVDDDRQWIAIQRQKIKDITARKQQNAAMCIQRHWRKHHKRLMKNRKVVKQPRVATPARDKFKTNNLRRENIVKPRILSMQEAAKAIQRAWRAYLKRRQQRAKPRQKLPTSLKELYEVIKRRYVARGTSPPSYVRFLKILERIHACTEGARVRKRLKTRRLQAVVKELKEIRVLLDDMSTETAPGSAELLSQLSSQLRQKTIQLHTALQGPGDAARYLIRRCPATPLVIYGSRSASPTQRTGEQVQIRVIGNPHTENGVPSLRCSLFTVNNNNYSDASKEKRTQDLPTKGEARKPSFVNHSKQSVVEKPPKKPPVIQHENPNRLDDEVQGRSTLDIPSSKNSHYHLTDRNKDTHIPSSDMNMDVLRLSHDSPNARTNRDQEECSATTSQVRNSNREHEEYGYERVILENDDVEQHSDTERPKRPFLRRKSIAMAPQKLDWSKVKPMVSSRLEPELKTKLYKSKVNASRNPISKKMNYNNVKSRLFNYETQSAVDSSGALSTDRSMDTDYEPSTSRQGYVEIHTQVDMNTNTKEDTLYTACAQEEPVPNYRYVDTGTVETETLRSAEYSRECSPRLPAPPYRYGKGSESSALEEIDHNGELERKKQNHSFRYKEQEASHSVNEQAVKETLVKREYINERKCDEKSTKSQNEVLFASPELEATFKHVMSIKNEAKMTVHHLFGVQEQEKTILPKLSPDAAVFSSSFAEKRRLHELLIQEGRASKLQHDSLAFVSTRD